MSESSDFPSQGSLAVEEDPVFGKAPLKLVTGRQTTTGLNFDLKPGAIVAHATSRVIFVCG